MRRYPVFIAALGLTLGAYACDSAGPSGPGVKVSVAPLTLPGILDTCYTLEVENDLGQTVWSKQHICASQYGNGIGDITYIGTCDAQDNAPTDGTAMNTVTLTVENLYTAQVDTNDYTLGAVPDSEWDNPCGKFADGTAVSPNGDGYGPCQLAFDCEENADVLVEFNVTIMRDANQGFFDIAVNFEDIFCSAKVDTCYAGGQAIELLFDRDAKRAPTAVFAFACTAGPGADVDTVLHLGSLAIDCGANGLLAIDPTVGPGNAWTFGGTPDDPDQEDFLFQYSVFEGTEQLDCGDDGDCNKRYWNVALGIDPTELPAGCSITALATASDGGFQNEANEVTGQLPGNTAYPLISVDVPIQAVGEQLACTQNGLNDGGGVSTTYTAIGPDHCPLELCYFEGDAGTTFVETWVDYTADGIPGITWAPSHYLQYAEMVGFDDAMSLTEYCAQAISGCCVENWIKYAEVLGTSAVAPPTAEFCENSPCVETYLKYNEGLGSEFAVPFLDFVEAGLCTGSCVENYLKYAEATGTNGNPTIIAIAEARVCERSCIESYLTYHESGSDTLPLLTWAAANCGEVE